MRDTVAEGAQNADEQAPPQDGDVVDTTIEVDPLEECVWFVDTDTDARVQIFWDDLPESMVILQSILAKLRQTGDIADNESDT